MVIFLMFLNVYLYFVISKTCFQCSETKVGYITTIIVIIIDSSLQSPKWLLLGFFPKFCDLAGTYKSSFCSISGDFMKKGNQLLIKKRHEITQSTMFIFINYYYINDINNKHVVLYYIALSSFANFYSLQCWAYRQDRRTNVLKLKPSLQTDGMVVIVKHETLQRQKRRCTL